MCYKMPVAKHIKNRMKYNYIRSKVLYFMENKCHESSTCRHKKKETLQYTLRRSQTQSYCTCFYLLFTFDHDTHFLLFFFFFLFVTQNKKSIYARQGRIKTLCNNKPNSNHHSFDFFLFTLHVIIFFLPFFVTYISTPYKKVIRRKNIHKHSPTRTRIKLRMTHP